MRQSDALVGDVLARYRATAESLDHTLVLVTADHGGNGARATPTRAVRQLPDPLHGLGPGVARGADLYALNPTYADPGRLRSRLRQGEAAVRNGDVANLVLDVLGLPPFPDSELDYDQDLGSSRTLTSL